MLADETLLELAHAPRFIGLRDSSSDVARLRRLRPRLPATRLPIVQLDGSSKAEIAKAMAEIADEYLAEA